MGEAQLSRAVAGRRAAQSLRLEVRTAATSDVLAAAGVDAIVLKGMSFARLLYPDGGRAPSGDVDVLVRQQDVPVARAALAGAGYEELDIVWAVDTRNTAVSFLRRVDGVDESAVDLHWSMHGAVADPELVWSVLFGTSEVQVMAGRPVRVLSPAGCALNVALHAARSGLGDKRGVDLRQAIRVLPTSDWARAAELACRLEVAEGFAAGLRLDPDGAELARRLSLTTVPPQPWLFSCGHVPRGAVRTHALLERPTLRTLLALVRPLLFPGAERLRREAVGFGRRSLVIAYLQYWLALLRSVPGAVRVAWAVHRRGRYFLSSDDGRDG